MYRTLDSNGPASFTKLRTKTYSMKDKRRVLGIFQISEFGPEFFLGNIYSAAEADLAYAQVVFKETILSVWLV